MKTTGMTMNDLADLLKTEEITHLFPPEYLTLLIINNLFSIGDDFLKIGADDLGHQRKETACRINNYLEERGYYKN